MSGALAGKAVVVTRSRGQAGPFVKMLEERGAEVLVFPTIELVEPEDWGPADAAIARLSEYDWSVFTSVNAVEAFMDRLAAHHLDAREFRDMSVAAVGPKTAERLSERGIVADVVPEEHVADAVAAALVEAGVGEGTRLLLPRALVAREVLPETLRESGAVVDVVPVYRNVLGSGDPEVAARIAAGDVDVIAFTSSSTVANFLELVADAEPPLDLGHVRIASIGPVTTRTARKLGLDVSIEPFEYTVAALVEAIENAFVDVPEV